MVPEVHGKQVWFNGSVKKGNTIVERENSKTDCEGAERLVDAAAKPPQFTGRRHFPNSQVVYAGTGKSTKRCVAGMAVGLSGQLASTN